MAGFWKYITELNLTDVAFEESDYVVINQGGNSVQIPWSLLKKGLEDRINDLSKAVDESAFISQSMTVEEEPETTMDDLIAKVNRVNDNLTNLQNLFAQTLETVRLLNIANSTLENRVETLENENKNLKNSIDNLPKIRFGDENPNDIIDSLNPKEGDVYIFTGLNTESQDISE